MLLRLFFFTTMLFDLCATRVLLYTARYWQPIWSVFITKFKSKSGIIALVCVLNRFAAFTVSSKVAYSLLLPYFIIFFCLILYFYLNFFSHVLLAEKVKSFDKNGKAAAIAHCCRVLVVTWKSMHRSALFKLRYLKSIPANILYNFTWAKILSCFFKAFESLCFDMLPFIDHCSSPFYILFPLWKSSFIF